MGKARKQRDCPAVDRRISSAECGEKRISHYDCPESCPFNPFSRANHQQVQDLEKTVGIRLAWRLFDDPDQERLHHKMMILIRRGDIARMEELMLGNVLIHRDENGLSFADRWEHDGFPGLRNDGRVFLRSRMKMRVGLLEVQKIGNDGIMHAIDLLDPDPRPMTILDHRLAATACRFTTLLTWYHSLPHYCRLSGSVTEICSRSHTSPLSQFLDAVRFLGGNPDDRDALAGWVVDNATRLREELDKGSRFSVIDDSDIDCRDWLDKPADAFDGLSPRDAVKDPVLRQRVIDQVKAWVRDFDALVLYGQECDEVDWIVDELGLDEIALPPPPARPIPERDEDDLEFNDKDAFDRSRYPVSDLDLPPCPPLNQPPFSIDEAARRYFGVISEIELPEKMIALLQTNGSNFFEAIGEICGGPGFENEEVFARMIQACIPAWFSLAPHDCRSPQLNLESLLDTFDLANQQLDEAMGNPEPGTNLLKDLLEKSAQPALAHLTAGVLLSQYEEKCFQATEEESAQITHAIVVIRSIIDELDRTLRSEPTEFAT